jgi:hypothetical protein
MALSADRLVDTKQVNLSNGIILDYQVAASTVIYEGGFVGLNAAGYLVMYDASTSDTTINGTRFVGIALEHIASQTSAGDARCKVLTEGMFEHALSNAVIADVGKPVWISDDDTLNISPAGNQPIGVIANLASAGNVVVRMFNQWQPATGLFARVSPIMDLTTANDLSHIIYPSENHNGILILWAGCFVTTTVAADTQIPIITLQDTAGTPTSVGFTFTFTDGDAATATALDYVAVTTAAMNNIGGTDGTATTFVPADLGLRANVTQEATDAGTAAGAAKVVVLAIAL